MGPFRVKWNEILLSRPRAALNMKKAHFLVKASRLAFYELLVLAMVGTKSEMHRETLENHLNQLITIYTNK